MRACGRGLGSSALFFVDHCLVEPIGQENDFGIFAIPADNGSPGSEFQVFVVIDGLNASKRRIVTAISLDAESLNVPIAFSEMTDERFFDRGRNGSVPLYGRDDSFAWGGGWWPGIASRDNRKKADSQENSCHRSLIVKCRLSHVNCGAVKW